MNIVTPYFLSLWFIVSFMVFLGLTCFFEDQMDDRRSVNTGIVLLAQGLGAILAYHAIYN